MTEHVKIYGVKPRIQYVADGTQRQYAFPFAIFKAGDIDVYCDDVLQDAGGYTVAQVRYSEGGHICFESAPTSGTMVTIVRNLAIERTSDFQEGGALRANTLNDELDYQIACQQQIADTLNRSMVLPPYAVDSAVDLTLPRPEAGKAIVWNKDGTNLENSSVEVNALESVLKGYKESAEAAAATAATKAQLASDKADIAANKADIATTQAQQAADKADEAAGALATKADIDMDNLSSDGKATLIALLMPDYSSGVDLRSYNSASNQYTASKDGWIVLSKNINANYFINGVQFSSASSNSYGGDTSVIPIPKNSTYYATGTVALATYYPCAGE